MSMPVYRIGTTSGNMASLESLGVPIPKAAPVDYAGYITLGDGSSRGIGWLCCEWRWAHLTLTQLAVIQAYFPTVYIQTLTEDGTYDVFTGTMVLPPKKAPKVNFMLDYAVEFRGMAAV